MIKNINIFSFVFLAWSIIFIEMAYREQKMTKGVNGVEILVMGVFTLFLPYILQIYTGEFVKSLIIAGIVIGVYYIVKSITVFFMNRSKFIRAKDDVSKEKESDDSDLEEDDDDIDD